MSGPMRQFSETPSLTRTSKSDSETRATTTGSTSHPLSSHMNLSESQRSCNSASKESVQSGYKPLGRCNLFQATGDIFYERGKRRSSTLSECRDPIEDPLKASPCCKVDVVEISIVTSPPDQTAIKGKYDTPYKRSVQDEDAKKMLTNDLSIDLLDSCRSPVFVPRIQQPSQRSLAPRNTADRFRDGMLHRRMQIDGLRFPRQRLNQQTVAPVEKRLFKIPSPSSQASGRPFIALPTSTQLRQVCLISMSCVYSVTPIGLLVLIG